VDPDVDPGALVLVATPIGNLGDLAPRAVEALRSADVIAAEDTRRTRALLTHAGVPGGSRVRAVHAHNERARAREIVEEVRRGRRVAYVTDAGMPGVSDPGERLVRACLDAGLPVEVVPGPSAALSALVLSGLPTGRFAFEGFLPRKGAERAARIGAIADDDRTTVLFEAPARVAATLADLVAACGPDRPAAVAREITKVHEEVRRGSLAELLAASGPAVARGEHVVVVGPAPRSEVSDEELDAALRRALADDPSPRHAAGAVAELLEVSRRRAYNAAIALRSASPPD
jgi:16S rRNA (cytidine1402-2'-O)-methyltransferase